MSELEWKEVEPEQEDWKKQILQRNGMENVRSVSCRSTSRRLER